MKISTSIYICTVFLLLFCSNALHSEQTISIPDTTIPRGKTYTIPVYATFENQLETSSVIKIEFNSLMLDIKSVSAGNGFIFSEEKLDFETKEGSIDKKILVISSKVPTAIKEGKLCEIQITALAGPLLSTKIIPFEFENNNTSTGNIKYTEGFISIDDPILIDYKEGFTIAYPNPFHSSTRLFFNIKKKTSVEFLVYNLSGTKIQAIPDEMTAIEYKIYREDETLIKNTESFKLERGTYYIELKPISNFFASGLYFVALKTSSGIYRKNIMHVR